MYYCIYPPQLDRVVQQMRDDIPTEEEREGGNDGGERAKEELRHLAIKDS